MKIIINATNQIEDRPLREVERLINSGKAHLLPQSGIVMPKLNADLIPLHNDGDVILNSKQQENLKAFIKETKDLPEIPFSNFVPSKEEQKIIEEYSEKSGWPIEMLSEITYEDLEELNIFREPAEIDVIEPIPIDHYASFEESKKMGAKDDYEGIPELSEGTKKALKSYKESRKNLKKPRKK